MNGAPELRLSGIVRLFVLCGALAALPALIVAGYAAYQHVESLRATELAHVEDETRTRAAGLGEFARIATGHVARMRLMFEAGLAAPQPSPLLAKLRGFAAGELAGAAEGVYFGREPSPRGPRTSGGGCGVPEASGCTAAGNRTSVATLSDVRAG